MAVHVANLSLHIQLFRIVFAITMMGDVPNISTAFRHIEKAWEMKQNVAKIDFVTEALPSAHQHLLEQGKLWNLFVLAVIYERNMKGANFKPGDIADVRKPYRTSHAQVSNAWHSQPELLKIVGRKNAVAMIWKGSGNDKTLYCVFTPARAGSASPFHVKQIWKESGGVNSTSGDILYPLRTSSYVKRKLNQLWTEGLARFWDEVLSSSEYHGYKIVIGGLSHGGTLAQAASYVIFRQVPELINHVYTVAWNSYPWTDADGAQKVYDTIGDRMLTIEASHREWKRDILKRYWDPVGSYDFGQDFVNMKQIRLLEVGCSRSASNQVPDDETLCGDFYKCDSNNGCLGESKPLGRKFKLRFDALHYGYIVQKGMKRATEKALAMLET